MNPLLVLSVFISGLAQPTYMKPGLIFVNAGLEGICRLLQAPKIYAGGPKLMPGFMQASP